MSEDLDKQRFLAELESIVEDDEAYGSNILILNYAVKNGVIVGKFRDSWNNRVYEFEIDKDAISYKPAVNLDSANLDSELARQFDLYSNGYNSLFDRQDGKMTGKRVKKPKCGSTAYGCGFSCIGLKKTCRILGRTGKKAGTNQGSGIGRERLNKLFELGNKALASGDKATFTNLNAIAKNISQARYKHGQKGSERLRERQVGRELEDIKETAQKSREARLNATKNQNERKTTKSNPPISSYKDFEVAALKAYSDLDKKINQGENDYVPIHKIRKEIGIGKLQFDQWLLDMQDKDIVQLISGDTGSMTPKEREESINFGGSGRHLIKRL